MLFEDILDRKHRILKPHFDLLFDMSLKNQTHSGDLLLVMENGCLSQRKDYDDEGKIKFFYELGLKMEGHCENTNYEYIRQYVRQTPSTYEEFKLLYNYGGSNRSTVETMDNEIAYNMQTEMLIYLKIWEGETFLKKWYQLTRLLQGKDYDWAFKFKKHDPKNPGGFTRDDLLKNHIKPILNQIIPNLGACFKKCHRAQIRNAIAHSQYAIFGRGITLNNWIEGKPDHVPHLDFHEWTDIFHETIVLFTLYDFLFKSVRDHYYNTSLATRKKVEIRVNWLLNPSPYTSFEVLYTRELFKDWSPYSNP